MGTWFSAWRGRSGVGLDIGTATVKLVDLWVPRGLPWELRTWGSASLGAGWVVDGRIEAFDELLQTVQRLAERLALKPRRVALALPNRAVVCKKVVLPTGLSPTACPPEVQRRVEEQLSIAPQEMQSDILTWDVPSSGPSEWHWVGARHDDVSDRLALLEALGWCPWALELDSHALLRTASHLLGAAGEGAPLGDWALVDMGAQTTRLSVWQGHRLLYEREQFGGSTPLRSLHSEATGAPLAGVTAPLAQIGTVLERLLQCFFSAFPRHTLSHVCLAGGGSGLPGLGEALTQRLGCPCHALATLAAQSPVLAAMPDPACAGEYAVALGLAARAGARA